LILMVSAPGNGFDLQISRPEIPEQMLIIDI
jgi:hypothetical protein